MIIVVGKDMLPSVISRHAARGRGLHAGPRSAQHRYSRISWLGGIGLRTRASNPPASVKSQDAPRFDDRCELFPASGTTVLDVVIRRVFTRARHDRQLCALAAPAAPPRWGCFLWSGVRQSRGRKPRSKTGRTQGFPFGASGAASGWSLYQLSRFSRLTNGSACGGGRAVAARRLPRCHCCSTPSIPTTRKLAYLLPTSASIGFCLT
jgi:hypothetical protein